VFKEASYHINSVEQLLKSKWCMMEFRTALHESLLDNIEFAIGDEGIIFFVMIITIFIETRKCDVQSSVQNYLDYVSEMNY
jgi:hypothetical protein